MSIGPAACRTRAESKDSQTTGFDQSAGHLLHCALAHLCDRFIAHCRLQHLAWGCHGVHRLQLRRRAVWAFDLAPRLQQRSRSQLAAGTRGLVTWHQQHRMLPRLCGGLRRRTRIGMRMVRCAQQHCAARCLARTRASTAQHRLPHHECCGAHLAPVITLPVGTP